MIYKHHTSVMEITFELIANRFFNSPQHFHISRKFSKSSLDTTIKKHGLGFTVGETGESIMKFINSLGVECDCNSCQCNTTQAHGTYYISAIITIISIAYPIQLSVEDFYEANFEKRKNDNDDDNDDVYVEQHFNNIFVELALGAVSVAHSNVDDMEIAVGGLLLSINLRAPIAPEHDDILESFVKRTNNRLKSQHELFEYLKSAIHNLLLVAEAILKCRINYPDSHDRNLFADIITGVPSVKIIGNEKIEKDFYKIHHTDIEHFVSKYLNTC